MADMSAVTYSLLSPPLPGGITLDPLTGILNGTFPRVTIPTSFSFQIMATSATYGTTSAKTFSILLIPTPAFSSATSVLFNGTDLKQSGQPSVCSVSVPATMLDSSALLFNQSAGTLPVGIVLNPNSGVLSGTFSRHVTTTTYIFQVTAYSVLYGTAASKNFSVVVLPVPLISSGSSLFSGTDIGPGTGGNFVNLATVNANLLDSSSISYAVSLGFLPTGITLNTANGQLSGTPAKVSTATMFTFSVTVTSLKYNTVANQSFNIVFTPARDGTASTRAAQNVSGLGTYQSVTGTYWIQSVSMASAQQYYVVFFAQFGGSILPWARLWVATTSMDFLGVLLIVVW